jgi:hypothetical protein
MAGHGFNLSDFEVPGDQERFAAFHAFYTAYNTRVVSDAHFPLPDICTLAGRRPAARFSGLAKTFAEAARSGSVANLDRLARRGGLDVNARDTFGSTALDWAMLRGDEAMARALIAYGADSGLRLRCGVGPYDCGAAPLARALQQHRVALANLMLAKGAAITGDTGLCGAYGRVGPDQGRRQPCSWAALLVESGRFDLLAAEARAGRLDGPSPAMAATGAPDPIDGRGELDQIFWRALEHGDKAIAFGLAPYVGRSQPEPLIRKALATGRPDLADIILKTRYRRAAHSLAEANLWRSAAMAGQHQALSFLVDYGGELNLLSPAELVACGRSAAAGDVPALFACARTAALRHNALTRAIKDQDTLRFQALLSRAADVGERDKKTLVLEAAADGTAPMLKALLRRGADPNPPMQNASWLGPPQVSENAPVFVGALSDQAQRWAGTAHYAEWMRPGTSPLETAVRRGEPAIVQVLADADPIDLNVQVQQLSRQRSAPSTGGAPGQVESLADLSADADQKRQRIEDILDAAFDRNRRREAEGAARAHSAAAG